MVTPGNGNEASDLVTASPCDLNTRRHTAASQYITASDGWKFPPPNSARRTDARRSRTTPLVKEPAGVRHAVIEHATTTLCGASVSDLTTFAHVGFFASRAFERCTSCEVFAVRSEADETSSLD